MNIIKELVYIECKNIEIDSVYERFWKITKKKQSRYINELFIACILDEFSYECLSKECRVIPITPDNYINELNINEVDFLLVESAWHGYNNTWEYKIAKYSKNNLYEIKSLIKYCKDNGISTVFWNKEDPIHFDNFIDTALLFDYIFTTDANMIPKYKRATCRDNVFTLPFAAQPQLHNPIKKYERINSISFAGSYYGNRHEERKLNMEKILDLCIKYNLTIYDRNYDNPNQIFKYPKKYEQYVKGALSYSDIDKAYKSFRAMMNVNSVKDSPTMFSRRVFEGLACGTPIISSYSLGIDLFFSDIVCCSDDMEVLDKHIKHIMTDDSYYKSISIRGIRAVMHSHTYTERLKYMTSKIGIKTNILERKVCIISLINNMEELLTIVSDFKQQNYFDKELILIFNSQFEGYIEAINEYNTEYIKTFLGYYLIHHITVLTQITNANYIALFSHTNKYGVYYIDDLMAAFIYSKAKVCGKGSYLQLMEDGFENIYSENEYSYVDDLLSDRCIFKSELFTEDKSFIKILSMVETCSFISKYLLGKPLLFSADNSEFIANVKKSKKIIETIDPINEIYMDIPALINFPQSANNLKDFELVKPKLYISVDVEAQPLRAKTEHIERLIYGRQAGMELGITKMMDIAEKYNIKITFFLDLAETLLYGNDIIDVGKYIYKRGHDLQIHMHADLITDEFWKKHLLEPNNDACKIGQIHSNMMIRYAVDCFSKINANTPLAYRGGGFRFNSNILSSLRKFNFYMDASYNYYAPPSNRPCAFMPNGQFVWENGIIEIPISVFLYNNNLQCIAFDSRRLSGDLLIEKYLFTYQNYFNEFFKQHGSNAIATLLLHSWSFFNKDEQGYFCIPNKNYPLIFEEFIKNYYKKFNFVNSNDIIQDVRNDRNIKIRSLPYN